MISEAHKPNIQELQSDVTQLLEQIADLMNRASQALSSSSPSQKYEQCRQDIDQHCTNVKKLELVMSIIAPMKAGKSTIINAIIGQDILPSRNAAMTTLPTEIIFQEDLSKPVLRLNSEILSTFQEAITCLQTKRQDIGTETVERKLAQYPHLIALMSKIESSDGLFVQSDVSGQEEIGKALTDLNDIVRLCSILEPSKDPLSQIQEVPRIETPFWKPQSSSQTDKLGNLVIVDTPGPNEAGENLRLSAVVESQLKRSSIVLIVLDFTQLNNKAAEEVRKQVQPIIKLLGKENLYVLVNKVDQRRAGDMTPEQVQTFVASDLQLSSIDNTDRVFEVSAIRAASATKFLLELQQSPEIDLQDMRTATALAQESLGARWEAKLKKSSVDELQEEAIFLWQEAGFEPFLEKAINALMENAAPRAIKSALNSSSRHLIELRNEIILRKSAISKEAEVLQDQIEKLNVDLEKLNNCRNRLKEVDKVKKNLEEKFDKDLSKFKQEAKTSIENFFKVKDYEQGDIPQKINIGVRELFSKTIRNINSLFPNFPDLVKNVEYKTSGEIKFSSKSEAEEFSKQATRLAKETVESLLKEVRHSTEEEVKKARLGLIDYLKKETHEIINKARERLNEEFQINLDLPALPTWDNDDFCSIKPLIKHETKEITDYKMESYRPWYFLWLIELERVVPITKTQSFYVVSLPDLVQRVNESIEFSTSSICESLNEYLERDLKDRMNLFFDSLDRYLNSYRDSLRQAQDDQNLSHTDQQKLINELTSLEAEANSHIDKTNTYIQQTEQFIADRK